jgi:hypothetical protein
MERLTLMLSNLSCNETLLLILFHSLTQLFQVSTAARIGFLPQPQRPPPRSQTAELAYQQSEF